MKLIIEYWIKNFKKRQFTIVLVFLFSLVLQTNFMNVMAQMPNNQMATPIKFMPPPPPPDRNAAGDRGGAASRGCGSENSLVALVPIYQQTINSGKGESVSLTKVWGLTTSNYPTFWFFIPYQNSSIAAMEFVLKDESIKPNQTIYSSQLTPPTAPGIISVNLPTTVTQLQSDKMYHWFLKLKVKCDQQPPVSEYVEGWVQRVNLNSNIVNLLKQETPQQQAAIYAENGIWYDSLTTLAQLRLVKPQDTTIATDWKNLLKSVGLEKFANQSPVNCCKSL
jgi:Domain of Unknown Function (DUF928)